MSNPGNMNVSNMIAAINAGNVDGVSAEQIGKLEGKEKTRVVKALKDNQGKGKVAELLREVEGGGGSGSGTALGERSVKEEPYIGIKAPSQTQKGNASVSGARKGFMQKTVEVKVPKRMRQNFTPDALRELLEQHRGQMINLDLSLAGGLGVDLIRFGQDYMEVLVEYRGNLVGLSLEGHADLGRLGSGERKAFFEGLGMLKGLTSLNLSSTELGGLPGGVSRALETRVLFEELGGLPGLTSLNLDNNFFYSLKGDARKAFIEGLGMLKGLRSLDLGEASFLPGFSEKETRAFFEELKNLPHLTSLNLEGMYLTRYLNYGDGSRHKIKDIIKGLGKLKGLTSLNLAHSGFNENQRNEVRTILHGCEINFDD